MATFSTTRMKDARGGANRTRPSTDLSRLLPRSPQAKPLPSRLPALADQSEAARLRRCELLQERGITVDRLCDDGSHVEASQLEGSIENFVGFARMPVGVVGPLRINGVEANGDFFVPMATTEGALVASYQRGANLVSLSGGVSAMVTDESVARVPCLVFGSMREAAQFVRWAADEFPYLQEIVAETSRHCRIKSASTRIIGKEVYVELEYSTGDAAGQNMVTIATDAICKTLIAQSPVKPRHWFVEGNLSGDKKATMRSFSSVRGKRVVAEVTLPARLVGRVLHTQPSQLVRFWKTATLGGIQSGSIGVAGHFSNALAAIFIACGQDAACVSEAAVGLNHFELTEEGDVYVAVTLPNVIVGTVGGGTHFPTARECLEMIGCYGAGKAGRLAEVCCATVLAGEISLYGAMAAGHFAGAHAQYGRRQRAV